MWGGAVSRGVVSTVRCGEVSSAFTEPQVVLCRGMSTSETGLIVGQEIEKNVSHKQGVMINKGYGCNVGRVLAYYV